MTEKNTDTVKPKNQAVSAVVPKNVFDDLEGYAYGTRRKVPAVIRDAVLEYYERNKAEIQEKMVPLP